MKSKLAGLAIFALGAVLPIALLWNPMHWSWADAIAARLDSRAAASAASQSGSGTAVDGAADAKGRKIKYWRAPMDPNYISDKPGKSPMGMDLIPVYEDEQPKQRKIKYWRAPMDPNYISDKPGKSPMGMDLIPVYEDEAPKESGIRVDPSFMQNFAVRTTEAKVGNIPVDIRTVGILDFNEKNLAFVNTKFEGWIEKAYVNYVGEPVKKGQVLFEVYSPQLVTTQQEYLATVEYVEKLAGRAEPDAVERARSLLKATTERLRYWDITDEQIARLRKTGKPTRTLQVVSPVSGIIAAKMSDSLEGMKITPGMNIFKVADLSTIWAKVEVYEDQIRYMQPGRRVDITVDAFPNRHWTGKVIYIDPTVSDKTRTLSAFVEIPNGDQVLRPQMYANVEMQVPSVSGAVIVPEEAVLHSGESAVVIVEKEKGLFQPRNVELGALGDGNREIRKGISAGEKVVTSSQFLIDSESNLKEAIQKMLTERSSAQKPSPAAGGEGMQMPGGQAPASKAAGAE